MSASLISTADVRPARARAVIVGALFAGAAAGLIAGAYGSAAVGDFELLHLLRAMAVLKLLFVFAAAAAILWRLQAPASPALLTAYAAALAATAAGPGQIWFMTNLILASVLLHAGLAACVLLLWRDGETGRLLERTIRERRTRARG